MRSLLRKYCQLLAAAKEAPEWNEMGIRRSIKGARINRTTDLYSSMKVGEGAAEAMVG